MGNDNALMLANAVGTSWHGSEKGETKAVDPGWVAIQRSASTEQVLSFRLKALPLSASLKTFKRTQGHLELVCPSKRNLA